MNDKIINFPGGSGAAAEDDGQQDGAGGGLGAVLGMTLSEDQEKALQVVLSGMSFVCVGIKPTGGGADFFTAVHGESGDLEDAQPHLGGVIDRAYSRKGLGH